MTDPEGGSPIKVDLGAKLALEVKAEVPTASVGQFVDALTDIIRPWTEKRGLKADLIRLQREDVAFEIAQRARRRIQLSNSEPSPIPFKTLIPQLEKVSQEEPDDDYMIDMWANLLASAADESSVPPRFIGIVGELNSRQARFLAYIAGSGPRYRSNRDEFVQHNVDQEVNEIIARYRSAADVRDRLRSYFYHADGIHLAVLRVATLTDWDWDKSGCRERRQTDLDILTSLGLLERINIFSERGRGEVSTISILYYSVTDLADALLRATRPPATGRS